MPKFNVEFKVSRSAEGYSETRHVKKTLENPVEVAALVQDAVVDGGGLEFLTVRRVVEKIVKPVVKVVK